MGGASLYCHSSTLISGYNKEAKIPVLAVLAARSSSIVTDEGESENVREADLEIWF